MTGLVEFLAARLDEDQALAEACIADIGSGRAGDRYDDDSGERFSDDFPSYPWGVGEAELAFMAGPAQPARVLAEVAAKRAVIEIADGYEAGWPATDNDADWDMEQILQALALPYADHPDYRSEWKP